MRYWQFNYNKAKHVVSTQDGYLWIVFETNPTYLVQVAESDPGTILDVVSLGFDIRTVNHVRYDDASSNIWVIGGHGSSETRKIAVVHKTLKTINVITLGATEYPGDVVFDTTYAWVGFAISPAKIRSYIKTTLIGVGELIFNVGDDYCFNMSRIDTEDYFWGNLSGKFFRVDISSPLSPSYDSWNISGISSIYSVKRDDNYIWLGSWSSTPALLIKAWLESGDIVDAESYILSSGITRVKAIEKIGDDIWLTTDTPDNIVKVSEVSGGITETNYSLDLFDSETCSPLIIGEDGIIYTGIESSPGILIQLSLDTVKVISTNFVTRIQRVLACLTSLFCVKQTNQMLNTDIRAKKQELVNLQTDFRSTLVPYDNIIPKALSNIVVYKDGIELEDVDYTTLQISFALNKTPSSASFIVARRHDNYDYMIDGTESIISNENKIEIYDGIKKIFTGYIETINALSDTDTVQVVAYDVRYKINKISMELEYGGKYNDDTQALTEISTKTALETLFSFISEYINGYDEIEFGFIPEYNKDYNDCGTLIDTLVNNSANINWFVDENEYIRFQKIGEGQIKELALSGLSTQRHVYDVILSNVTLNRRTDNYVSSYDVKLGKQFIKTYYRSFPFFASSTQQLIFQYPRDVAKDFTWFGFQQWNKYMKTSSYNLLYLYRMSHVSDPWIGASFVGQNIEALYGTGLPNTPGAGVVKPFFIYQWAIENNETELETITVGSGEPKKTLYLTNYDKKVSNEYWLAEQVSNVLEWEAWLYVVRDLNYDYTEFARDYANFELSQNNKLFTEASVTLLLDSFEYYGISFKDLINLTNTISTDIYKNNNGFPLNISDIRIDCSNRVVTLNLTNYGKNYYRRVGNIVSSFVLPVKQSFMRQSSLFQWNIT